MVWEHGDFVASTMLQWKGGYDDGRLGRWTRADLAEYLLDYFPRKVSVDDETLGAVPDCVRAFLGFLEERGSLTGEPLEQLEHALGELRDEFHQRARDNSQWGLAKSMVMQMQAEGADPCAPGALDTWITDFNARLPEQREQIIGPAADRMTHAAGLRPAAGTPAPKQRAQRRKTQRAARKRKPTTLELKAPCREMTRPGRQERVRVVAACGCGGRSPPAQTQPLDSRRSCGWSRREAAAGSAPTAAPGLTVPDGPGHANDLSHANLPSTKAGLAQPSTRVAQIARSRGHEHADGALVIRRRRP